MGQTGWRLPDDLLKRVRVHCAQTGERQNEFVRQALEKALGGASAGEAPSAQNSVSAPSPTPAKKKPAAPLGKGFVPPRPKAK